MLSPPVLSITHSLVWETGCVVSRYYLLKIIIRTIVCFLPCQNGMLSPIANNLVSPDLLQALLFVAYKKVHRKKRMAVSFENGMSLGAHFYFWGLVSRTRSYKSDRKTEPDWAYTYLCSKVSHIISIDRNHVQV